MKKIAVLLVLGSFMAITVDAQTKTRQCRGKCKTDYIVINKQFTSVFNSAREMLIISRESSITSRSHVQYIRTIHAFRKVFK